MSPLFLSLWIFIILCKFSIGKLVSVVSHVDVRGSIVCTLCVMYVSMGNLRKSVVLCKLSVGKLVDVMQRYDVRRCIVWTLYVMYVSMGNVQSLEQLETSTSSS